MANRGDIELNQEDLREHWEERAAIMEYDGGQHRAAAEQDAWYAVWKMHLVRAVKAATR